MALNWSIENCNDWNTLITDSEWGKTEALIWTTMVIGMNEITAKNADEFYNRVKLVEKATGNLAVSADGEYYFTKEDITRRIGLCTNASTLSKAKFNKHLLNLMDREVARA